MQKALIIKKIKDWFIKDKKIILASLLVGMIITIISAFATYSNEIQGGISSEVIRFHVLANSDSEEDQDLKNLVRDGIIDYLRDILTGDEDLDKTRALLTENLQNIKSHAERIIDENGYTYTVSIEIAESVFPTRIYGGAAFPAGKYEALRVIIGEGGGQNWWCVMFPPLCFVDITQAELPEETIESLKNILTEEEYDIVLHLDNGEPPFKAKFKVVEWWQRLKNVFV